MAGKNDAFDPFHEVLYRVVQAKLTEIGIDARALAGKLGIHYRLLMFWLSGQRKIPAEIIQGVFHDVYQPARAKRDAAIRLSIKRISERVRRITGEAPQNIAVLATWGRGVNLITRALTGDGTNRIPHRVIIDEAQVLLSSRLVAFLLEPRQSEENELLEVAESIEIAASVFRSMGSPTRISQANQLKKQADHARAGTRPKTNTVAQAFLSLLRAQRTMHFSGDPRQDWLLVRRQLGESGNSTLTKLAGYAEQLIAFQRGQRIAAHLTQLWQANASYRGAREVLNDALAQDQILGSADEQSGIHVMTIHKAKGKEFDAVVIYDDPRNSPIHCSEQPPFSRSRKLLRVGVTRARHCVTLLTDVSRPSPLTAGHHLKL